MKRLAVITLAAAALTGCHSFDDDEPGPGPVGNFDALWQIIDCRYCFLREKGIDWDSVYRVYRPRVDGGTSSAELFRICSEMLDELRDGHVNLSGWYSTSYYSKWWSDYPQNYDWRLVEQYYLDFEPYRRGGLTYAMLRPDSVGYIRYPSFSADPGESTLDWAFAILADAKGLVIDVRDNGGGALTNVETLVARFIDRRILAGFITHKTGPGRDAFSEPFAYYYDPSPRRHWDKPVAVLCNRSTYSAANNFVSVMSHLPQVTVVGDRTGGGSGLPFSSELPYGWGVRFSGSPVYDCKMQLTEFGVDPDIKVDLDQLAALRGRDTMLDAAIEAVTSQ